MNTIAIIGLGPRGSLLLERLITRIIKEKTQDQVHLMLFEKNDKRGHGCHYPYLPNNLLTNTIAGQMTMYFGEEMKSHGLVYKGDCLYDWYRKKHDHSVKASDYLPRKVLGEYLCDFYQSQVARMKKHKISFQEINEEVVDIVNSIGQIIIKTKDSEHMTSQAVLCVGHQISENNNEEILSDFLSYNDLEKIEDKKTVAVQGIGLTAFDIISQLTEGRGGYYEKINNTELKYIPSGREPKLYLYSRNGIFNSGRAVNTNPNFIYKPTYLTKSKIKALCSKGTLDFDLDFLPLLKQELEHAYSSRTGGRKLDIDAFFNPEKYINSESQKHFCDSFLSYLRWDIEQCSTGKMGSAYKFCQDVIRDLRDQLRLITDFRGMATESYHHFQHYWNPKFLKICVGPPYIRLMQLEALIKSGNCFVEFALNPHVKKTANGFTLTCHYKYEQKEIVVQCLVKACIPSINFRETKNKFIENISKKFKVFQVNGINYGGLEINENYEVFDLKNEACKNIYAFGIPTEGSKYFTMVLGRPNMESTFLLDGNNLADIILDKIHREQKLKETAYVNITK